MSSPKTYVVTGANRGIGKGLVAAYLSEPQTTVIAAVRDPSHPTAQTLLSLTKAQGSRLVVVLLDVGSSKSIADAMETIQTDHGVQTIDVVISSAGVGEVTGRLVETPLPVIQNYIDVNAYGPLALFKAALPLLRHAQQPKFCIISSLGGSNAALNTMLPTASYNASKLLVNHFGRWLAQEVPEIITWSMHPGMVATDMGKTGLEAMKRLLPDVDQSALKLLSIDDSVAGLRNVIATATSEETSGHFLNYDGTNLPW